tara:strand:- start:289 stop:480 length:192 start_codon:yes stop_codon:yes gene_type:complete
MKQKAIQIVKDLTRSIDKMEGKANVIGLVRTDMFSAPTASRSKLKRKRQELIERYNLKEKEWK